MEQGGRQWTCRQAVIKVAPPSTRLRRSLEPISSIEAGAAGGRGLISRSLKRITFLPSPFPPCGLLGKTIHSLSHPLTPALQFEFCPCRDSDTALQNQMGLKVNPPPPPFSSSSCFCLEEAALACFIFSFEAEDVSSTELGFSVTWIRDP